MWYSHFFSQLLFTWFVDFLLSTEVSPCPGNTISSPEGPTASVCGGHSCATKTPSGKGFLTWVWYKETVFVSQALMNYFSSRKPPYAEGHLSSQADPQPVINACRKIKFWPCKSKQDSLRDHASSTTSLEVLLEYIAPQVLPVFSCFLHHSFTDRVQECTFLTSCILNICLLPMESKVLYYSEEWGKKWLAMRSSLLAAGEQVAPDIRWCSSC